MSVPCHVILPQNRQRRFSTDTTEGLNELFPGMMESVQGPHDTFTWFTQSQLRFVIQNGIVPEWFHGIITRKAAEELLMSKPPGYFLIRVSESRIGYSLSYRAAAGFRHFMIDALEDGHYIIVGENRRHRFLQDLVDFHRRTPIMPYTEVLTVACGQTSNDKTDYAELLFHQRRPNPNASLPNNSLHPNTSHPVLQDVPPALPYRPNNLMSPAGPSPSRLYPCLEEEVTHTNPPLPATPVPMTRKRYTADNPPSDQPPDLPARSLVPPPRQNQACIRTISASEGPTAPTAAEHPVGASVQSAKNQEAKLLVVTNFKNLKKKFQKKISTSPEFMYAEANEEASDRSGNAENEYQEIAGEHTLSSPPPFSYTGTNLTLTNGQLPQEYLPPPPFAPGY